MPADIRKAAALSTDTPECAKWSRAFRPEYSVADISTRCSDAGSYRGILEPSRDYASMTGSSSPDRAGCYLFSRVSEHGSRHGLADFFERNVPIA